mmetsp:Transcript_30229/g.37345  ORF Transcript_30229/g.37345 Transcript_30229/m.37345 type:complete len:301 (+) Transcript_30229:351-1253(+)
MFYSVWRLCAKRPNTMIMGGFGFRGLCFVLVVFWLFCYGAAVEKQEQEARSECASQIGLQNQNGDGGDKSTADSCGCGQLSRSNVPALDTKVSENDDIIFEGKSKSKAPLYVELVDAFKKGKLREYEYAETELLEIPGGEFTMGTDDPAIPEDGEMPARPVRISTFLLQKYEVSNRQFAQFVLETGYKTESEQFNWSFCFEGTLSKEVNERITSAVEAVPWWLPVEGSDWFHPNGPDSNILSLGYLNHPVVHVSHNDARTYCEWLGLRLPTEAEFERASGMSLIALHHYHKQIAELCDTR